MEEEEPLHHSKGEEMAVNVTEEVVEVVYRPIMVVEGEYCKKVVEGVERSKAEAWSDSEWKGHHSDRKARKFLHF